MTAGLYSTGLFPAGRWMATGLCIFYLLLRLAVPSPAQTAADALGTDPRLAIKRTLLFQDTPVRDFLADLNLQTGIRFFAHETVADDRLTVFAHDRPLKETLRAVAGFFGFEWRRSGSAPDYAYTLIEPPSTRMRQEKERKLRIAEVAKQIVEEVELFDRFESLTSLRLLERADQAAEELSSCTDPARRRALGMELAVIDQVRAKNEWRVLANRFFRRLTESEIEALLGGAPVEYHWPKIEGSREFDAAVVQDIKLAMTGGATAVPTLSSITFIRLRLSAELAAEPSVRWHFILGKRNANSFSQPEFASTLPSTGGLTAPGAGDPAPDNWESDPALAAPATLSLDGPAAESRGRGYSGQRRTLGEALDALVRQRPLDVIADSFLSTRLPGVRIDERPIGEVLTRISRLIGHRWWKQNGFIFIRSLNFDMDRRMEPPATAVARWAERALTVGLELDDYAEMAMLSDAQINTLSRMAIRGEFPDSLQPLTQARDHLRLWNALTHAQRRKASEAGVPYASLNSEQQRFFAHAVKDPRAAPGFATPPRADLSASRLRLAIKENRLWGVRQGDSTRLAGMSSREEAVFQFQRSDPSVKPEEVRQVVFATVSFVYETDRGEIARAWASLPQRWE